MSSLSDGFSSAVQESVISANLNSGMFFNFLMGVYTLSYVGTVYLYASQESKKTHINHGIVVTTISILYMLCLGVFVIEWYYLDLAIIVDGNSRGSIFDSTLNGGPLWVFILHQILFFGVFIVSDGLLIWRCYYVWGRSLRIILLPLILFIGQIGLFFAVIVLAGLVTSVNSNINATVANDIQSAQTLVSFGTTVVAASLIGYRIHSVTKTMHRSTRSKELFKHVVVIVIESAAMYAVVILVYAVYGIRMSSAGVGSTLWNSSYYVEAMATWIGGMAPTVLAARIIITSPHARREDKRNGIISNIHFCERKNAEIDGADDAREKPIENEN